MACPAPLDTWERQLGSVIERTASWRIDGQTLELLDAGGSPLALFQAVYLY
jgi:heat shock protein HslJ